MFFFLWVFNLTPSRTLRISDTSSSYKSPLATISADGWVHTTSRHMLTSTCELNLQLFPFDMQKCNISFGSMSSSGEVWHINPFICCFFVFVFFLKTSFMCNTFLLQLTMVRKPLLYVVSFIVPLFFLLVLDLASSSISEASKARL